MLTACFSFCQKVKRVKQKMENKTIKHIYVRQDGLEHLETGEFYLIQKKDTLSKGRSFANGLIHTYAGDTTWVTHKDRPEYKGMMINGKKEGQWVFVHRLGYTGHLLYKNDKQVGDVSSFFPNGKPFVHYHLDDSSKQDGRFVLMNAQNDTAAVIHFKADKPHGTMWTKYSSGNYFCKAIYRNGKLWTYDEFDSEGKLNPESSVKDGNGTVLIKSATESKTEPIMEVRFENGYLHGPSTNFQVTNGENMEFYKKGVLVESMYEKSSDSSTNWSSWFAYMMFKDKSGRYLGYGRAKFGDTELELALDRYVDDNIRVPDIAYEMAKSGQVIVEFTVEQDGRVSNLTIGSDVKLGYGVEQACLNVIEQTSGSWRPFTRFGLPQRIRFTKPIGFNFF